MPAICKFHTRLWYSSMKVKWFQCSCFQQICVIMSVNYAKRSKSKNDSLKFLYLSPWPVYFFYYLPNYWSALWPNVVIGTLKAICDSRAEKQRRLQVPYRILLFGQNLWRHRFSFRLYARISTKPVAIGEIVISIWQPFRAPILNLWLSDN